METFKHRWGIKYTSDPTKNISYLQTEFDNIEDFARPGELFLNESLQQIYYVDNEGIAKGILPTPKSIVTLDYSLTIEPDALQGRTFKLTLTGDTTLNPILNAQEGEEYIFLFYQDNVGLRNIIFDETFILKTPYIPQNSNTLISYRFLYDKINFIEI